MGIAWRRARSSLLLEKDHRATAQGLDLRSRQLRGSCSDQQFRAQSPQHVGGLSAHVHRGLCADPVAGS